MLHLGKLGSCFNYTFHVALLTNRDWWVDSPYVIKGKKWIAIETHLYLTTSE